MDSVGIVKDKEVADRQELLQCLEDFGNMLAEESGEDWVTQENAALTGTLLQKMNKILGKANLKVYAAQFENVVDSYIELEIMHYIDDHDYRQLMCRLIYLDICRKFEGKF